MFPQIIEEDIEEEKEGAIDSQSFSDFENEVKQISQQAAEKHQYYQFWIKSNEAKIAIDEEIEICLSKAELLFMKQEKQAKQALDEE